MNTKHLITLITIILHLKPTLGGYSGSFTCRPKQGLFPYYISFVASVYKEECILYQEDHICSDYGIGFRFTNKKEDVLFELLDGSERYFGYQWKNHRGPKDKVDTFSVEVMYNIVVLYDDFSPIKEFMLSSSDSHIWRAIQKCPSVVFSNGNCPKQRPCQIQSCMQKLHVPDYGCKEKELPSCLNNRGYCHGGECYNGEFGEYCKCDKKGFLRGPYIGEFCHIRDDDVFEKEAKFLRAFDIEVDYEENYASFVISSTFENYWFNKYEVKLIRVPENKITEAKYDLKPNSKGDATWRVPVVANTSYVFRVEGSEGGEERKDVSFYHFTEIHTPGYTLLPAPKDLSISLQEGNLFLLSWRYYDEIPAKEFAIRMKTADRDEEYVVSLDTSELLALHSNISYVISVSTINSVGESGKESTLLTYKTPIFEYVPRKHGKYDLSKWFIKNNTISLDDRWVYFKNAIRRDVRIKRLVVMLDTGAHTKNMSTIYDAARFQQSYEDHVLDTPYITASFSEIPLPKRIFLGDGAVYEEYYNGFLDKHFVYQCYAIVWYMSGNTEDISVQYLGVIKQSLFPWIPVAISMACGTVILTIFSTLFNCCTHYIVLKRVAKRRRQEMKLGENSQNSKTSLIEKIYSEDILCNPDYDMAEPKSSSSSLHTSKSTFSMVHDFS